MKPNDALLSEELLIEDDEDASQLCCMNSIHWKSKTVLYFFQKRDQRIEDLSNVFSVVHASCFHDQSGANHKSADLVVINSMSDALQIVKSLRDLNGFRYVPILVHDADEHCLDSLLEYGASAVLSSASSKRLILQCKSLLLSTQALAIERTSIEMSVTPTMVVDEAGQIIVANTAAREIFQILDDESDSSIWRQNLLIPELGKTLNEVSVSQIAPINSRFDCEYRLQNNHFAPLYLEGILGSIVLREGKLFSIVFEDVTKERLMRNGEEKRKVEAIYNEKMRILGELASHVAHEINNPLAVIQARISLLNDTIQEEGGINTESRRDIVVKLESVEKSATRIERIVKSLYRFSRNEAEEDFQKAFAHDIIQETLDLCSSRFANHGVVLKRREIDSDLSIDCRSLQISQILLNLLTNAFDAIGESTVRGDKDRWVSIDCVRESNSIVFRVMNGGPRISKEIASKVFGAYFTTKPVGQGTGLGLSISKSLAISHGGDLYVDEAEEHTCFALKIPQARNVSSDR